MNPTAIYSKTGKGVQEASGKTSHLSRADRAVLAAIDGKATLAELQGKFDKIGADRLEALIRQLDRDGFVREVSAGAPVAAPARAALRPGAPAPGAPKASAETGEELDFTQAIRIPPRGPAPPPAPPKPQIDLAALAKAEAEARAKAEAEAKARAAVEAEAKVKAAREAALRAAIEAKAKADAEAKARAEAEAKLEAERARAEAERRAREEAERKARQEAERKAREEAERARREAEEKAQREQEALRRQLEAERARAEAERRAREEAEQKAKHEAERRRREEEERIRREEEEARRRREEEEARRRREEEEARRRREEEQAQANRDALAATLPPKTRPTPAPEPSSSLAALPAIEDSLLADLDSFSRREEEERRRKEEADRKAKEERERRLREQEERQAREEEEARRRAEEERRLREEEERRAREQVERAAREEAERRMREVEERKRQVQEALAAHAQPQAAEEVVVRDEDLDLEEVRREQERLEKRARERDEARREREPETAVAAGRRRARKWSKPIAIGVFVALLAALIGLHVMPLSTADYERAASRALGVPVRIGSARLSVITGVQLKLERVAIGDSVRVDLVRAHPSVGGLLGSRKSFASVELEKARIGQQALGSALFGALKGDELQVARLTLRQARLEGPLALPELDGEVVLAGDGSVQAVRLSGPDKLRVSIAPKAGEAKLELESASFALPFVPGLSIADFGMKGSFTREAMNVTEFDGRLYDGVLSGSGHIRWGADWTVEGTLAAKNVNAAVFAPALLSEGRAEAKGQFRMRGADPARLGESARLEGGFRIDKGVLGSFDLARALQSGGAHSAGRTENVEVLAPQALYDRGAVQLRNVTIGRGPLHAGALLDVGADGALAGRIVGELRTPARTLGATFALGGTIKDPQLRR